MPSPPLPTDPDEEKMKKYEDMFLTEYEHSVLDYIPYSVWVPGIEARVNYNSQAMM